MVPARILLWLFLSLLPGLTLAAGGEPTPVIVTEVTQKPFVDEVEALGTLQANESVELTSTVTELVTAVNFADGQRVAKGDLLLEMQSAEERAELTEAQSNMQEAKLQLERVQPLTRKGVASESLRDERRRNFEAARARVEAIQSRIDRRRITAPFDGVLGIRNVSVGALLQPGTLITTLDDDSLMKLDFSVPSVFLPALHVGMNIKAGAKALDTVFAGTVDSIDSRVDPVTRSIKVRALIANPERILKPGLLMRVALQKNPRRVLVIPEEAIIAEAQRSMVLVIVHKDNITTVEKRRVELGERRKGEAEILSGLQEGERIVTHGTLRVRPGMPVKITAVQTGEESLPQLLQQQPAAEPAE